MRLLTIQFEDSVDVSSLPKGTTVTVSDGSNTVSDGTVLAVSDVQDPEVLPHNHPANTTIGLPII